MTSAFTSLAAHSLEDTMEVSSSPAANTFDNDIDIDFDDYGGGIHLTDDERMLEDGDPTRPPTATDEMMDDGEQDTTVVEEVMHDDPPNDQATQPEPADEELIDYDDDSYLDVNQSFFDDTTLQNTETNFGASTEVAPEAEHIHEEVAREPELFTEEQANLEEHHIPSLGETEATGPEAPTQEEQHSAIQGAIEDQTEHDAPEAQAHDSEEVGVGATDVGQAAGDSAEGPRDEDEAAVAEPEHGDDAIGTLKAPPHFPGTLDTSYREVSDGPPTPTDTGLPPMTIHYGDYSMPMFKCSKQRDGLLKDDNLASIGLSSLMQNCRERVQVKLGQTIPEDQYIVLSFDRLGLMILECDHSAFNTSLHNIIEIWQQLHFNDGFEDIPPLSVTLTSQPKFSSALSTLQEAINDGQGISSFGHLDASENEGQEGEQELPVPDEHDAQENEEFAAGEEEQFQEAYDEEYANEHEQYQEGEGEEYQEGQEITEESNAENQADQYPEDGYGNEIAYADFDEHEEYPDPEDFDQDQELATTAEHAGAQEDQDDPHHESEEHSDTKLEKPSETVEPDSAASSTTVRGDTANGATDAEASQGQDDFSTLDYVDAGEEAPENAEEPSKEAENVQEEQVTLGLESEDFLNADISNQPEGEGEATDLNAEQYQHDPDESLIEYEEETFNEADCVDYDNQDENELGEDDEQFHTAFDLLQGDDTEHGPEQANATDAGDQPPEQVPDEDDIGYDDDEFPESETTTKGKTNSPLGKRSFEDHADEDELDFDEPELKKARSD